ncbi:hypothetical protein [Magnetospirillum sp. UT-4]|uniref:hypothetical protein n=1 Tax=Magnetospirillum sp. UT-4 TaxID=2681467 RepID=UPI00138643F9|nr:hypothetical protein [Magnetospirillum sp. UT-4]CAA7616604.1 membrane hypothetical protein [Magnetospirillum sp. UT-4]
MVAALACALACALFAAAFLLGAAGEDAAIAAVAASAFMVVGVLLGWIFLKVRIGAACWGGVALVFLGVALLSI